MHLQTWAELALIFFVLIFGLVTMLLLGALTFALIKMQRQVEKITEKIDPIIAKTSDTLDSVQRVTATVGEKADSILSRGEKMTENVSSNVERTASVVRSAVTTPLINLSSILTGVTKGFSVWGRSATGGTNNGKSNVYANTTVNTEE
jgi:predicted PurR-regulated permease PerM